jgi:two-component system, OmpR family, alkaline phosphatase synthesis response regulator PhoP
MNLVQIMSNSASCYEDAHLEVDFDRRVAALDSQRLLLTRKEYDLLALLVQNAGAIVPREALLMRVWGYSKEIRTRTLHVHIRKLRKKLGSQGRQYIETAYGIGYGFQPLPTTQCFQPGSPSRGLALTA